MNSIDVLNLINLYDVLSMRMHSLIASHALSNVGLFDKVILLNLYNVLSMRMHSLIGSHGLSDVGLFDKKDNPLIVVKYVVLSITIIILKI